MSPDATHLHPPSDRFPRVSGDEPRVNELFHDMIEFSPRERG